MAEMKPGLVACSCNCSTQKAEAVNGESESNLDYNRRLCHEREDLGGDSYAL